MEFTLRDYQRKDVDQLVENKRVINANEPGLGKTLEALVAMDESNFVNALIVCPKIATGVWQTEAKKWFNWDSIILTGTPKERKLLIKEYRERGLNILITNYAKLDEVNAFCPKWDFIIYDEAHLGGLLNPKTQKFKSLKKYVCNKLYLLTGTPIRRNPADIWGMLHLLDPKKFKSYWGFVHRYCKVINSGFGKEILRAPKDPEVFRDLIKPYIIRNLKKDVLEDLPPKVRQTLQIDLDKEQTQAYKEILEEMMLITEEDVLLTPSRLTQDLRFRQLLVCPKILGLQGYGAALEALGDYLIPREFDAGRAVVIGTPFRTAVPFIREYIESKLPGTHVEEIHGGIKENANDVAKRFQAHPGKQKVLIYTIKAGAAWTAHTASTGFMLGYEWSTADMFQAEDRIHRIGQKDHVHWYYLLHPETIDQAVLDTLNKKNQAAEWVLNTTVMIEHYEKLRKKYALQKAQKR